ncbi:MAG: hypothetical protein ACRDRW_21690 [Pseudonocardiaceae bacterium]
MTATLEEEIEEFIITLEKCLDAKSVEWHCVLKLKTLLGPECEWSISGRMASRLARSPLTSFSAPGFSGSVVESRVLAAPVDSVEFGEFFLLAVKEIRMLIKEVTLGAQALS